ncbi:hypothetical protein OROGR_017647 [Orobanche gracilis]
MSINHYCSDLTQPQWWSHYMMDSSANTSSPNQNPSFVPTDIHFLNNSTAGSICQLSHNHHYRATAMFCNRNGGVGFDLNNENEEEERSSQATAAMESGEEVTEIPTERLFEKPLTPSDVGKLNRLVIPKQHAERHFPLNGGAAEPGENGHLLGFEDETGKSWRFRYSYWNSSQSYVLTKGWSRFVKEKRLDAGDIVVFSRHRVETGRFFIGWRRRDLVGTGTQDSVVSQTTAAVANGGGGWTRVFYPSQYPYSSQHQQAGPSSLPYQPESLHAAVYTVAELSQRLRTVTQQNQTTSGNGNSKRLRLFGVNMECDQPAPDESEQPSTPMSSQLDQAHHHHHPYHQYYSSSSHM